MFGGTDNNDPLYAEGRDFAGLTLAFYNVVTVAFAFFLPAIADKLGRKLTHALCLLCGAIGLISVGGSRINICSMRVMTGVGIAWTSILSMPLCHAQRLPAKR
ncbi:MAG: MFS transporter [Bacteroidota bacterium]